MNSIQKTGSLAICYPTEAAITLQITLHATNHDYSSSRKYCSGLITSSKGINMFSRLFIEIVSTSKYNQFWRAIFLFQKDNNVSIRTK